jgi:hypothetical protein
VIGIDANVLVRYLTQDDPVQSALATGVQDLSNQVAKLKAAGCAAIFRENISGATVERPQLRKLRLREASRSAASLAVSQATISRLAV